jgi:hypothetical protein
MIGELERIWKEAVVVYLRQYLDVCVEGVKENHERPQSGHPV